MSKETPAARSSFKRQVLLVDDHPILREGFAQLIDHEPDLQVCGQADNASEALKQMQARRPDLVVVDISLKGTNGIELIKQIKALHPEANILVLSVHDEALYAERALHAGAKGYVMKQAPRGEVMQAIRSVVRGGRYLSVTMQERMLENLSTGAASRSPLNLECLSDRELEVFQLIGAGLGTRQIAAQLHLSIKTVETYRAHIKEKLKLRTHIDLIRAAMEATNQSGASGNSPQNRPQP